MAGAERQPRPGSWICLSSPQLSGDRSPVGSVLCTTGWKARSSPINQSINQDVRKSPQTSPLAANRWFQHQPRLLGQMWRSAVPGGGVSPVDPVLLSRGTLLSSVHDPALKSQNVANQPRSLNLEKNFGESDQNMLLASQPEKCQDSCDHGGFLESELCLITRARKKGQFLSTR